MRNSSFPTLRAVGRAAAQFADANSIFSRCTRYTQFLTLMALSAGVSLAQSTPPDIAKKLDDLDKAVKNAQMAGDNAWMLTSAALVLMMTGPGLALFYGGLVRKKNVLGTMMHSFILMATVSILWALVGYSLSFGEGNAFFGDLRYLFLRGVGADPNPDYAATIPHQTYMIYQLMFAIITPALISGAFAERMKFKAMLLFMTLWSLVVYFPMAHMVWGKGGLLNAALGGAYPAYFLRGISRAERWCTSHREFPLWFARCTWASGTTIRTNRCVRTAWC